MSTVFSDNAQSSFDPGGGTKVVAGQLRATVRLGPGGRIVIPADMREALGLKQGDTMLAVCNDTGLTLVTVSETVLALQAITNKYVPDSVSLVEQFIAEKRAEVRAEEEADALADAEFLKRRG